LTSYSKILLAYYITSTLLMTVYSLFILWHVYLASKSWKTLLPRSKNSLLISAIFCLALLVLMFTSFKWQNSIYLSAPKIVSLLLLWNAYLYLLMYLHMQSKAKEQATPGTPDELPSSSAFFSGLDIPQREVVQQEEPVMNSKNLKIMKKPSLDLPKSKPHLDGKFRRHLTNIDEKRLSTPLGKVKVETAHNFKDDDLDLSQL